MRQISRAAAENEFSIITYCFMPDHLHLLVEGQSDSSDGKHFVARAKQYTGYYHKKEFNEVLWQRYGFEHVLRDDEITMVVARYILMNPVRAGLVQKPQDYRYSGSSVYTMEQLLEAVGSA
jgi:putative transposase